MWDRRLRDYNYMSTELIYMNGDVHKHFHWWLTILCSHYLKLDSYNLIRKATSTHIYLMVSVCINIQCLYIFIIKSSPVAFLWCISSTKDTFLDLEIQRGNNIHTSQCELNSWAWLGNKLKIKYVFISSNLTPFTYDKL